jgi:hypothetical protein
LNRTGRKFGYASVIREYQLTESAQFKRLGLAIWLNNVARWMAPINVVDVLMEGGNHRRAAPRVHWQFSTTIPTMTQSPKCEIWYHILICFEPPWPYPALIQAWRGDVAQSEQLCTTTYWKASGKRPHPMPGETGQGRTHRGGCLGIRLNPLSAFTTPLQTYHLGTIRIGQIHAWRLSYLKILFLSATRARRHRCRYKMDICSLSSWTKILP